MIGLRGLMTNKYVQSLINFFKYSIIICIIPPIINYAAISREMSVLADHGLPYDIRMGQKLFLSCRGEGVPTIIMDAPTGFNSDIWLPLQKKLSEITKVCIYDRAGIGLSERPRDLNSSSSEQTKKAKIQLGQEFTIERMVEDLRRLISTSSQQERPLIFVGAELGAMIARFYTQIYDTEVSDLILINPLVENLFMLDESLWKNFWYNDLIPRIYGYALGSITGINRLLLMAQFISPQVESSEFDEKALNRQKHLMCNPKHLFSSIDEFINMNETFAQMRLIWSIKQFPQNVTVTVLSSKMDNIFGKSFLSETSSKNEYKNSLLDTWQKSQDYLKSRLHPNAEKIELKAGESAYEQLLNNPNYLFEFIKKKIHTWRSNNATFKQS